MQEFPIAPITPPFEFKSSGRVSVWEVMRKFTGSNTCALFPFMGAFTVKCSQQPPDRVISESVRNELEIKILLPCWFLCGEIGLKKASESVAQIKKDTEQGPVTFSEILWKLDSLIKLMESDMRDLLYFSLAPNEVEYYQNKQPFGEQVYKSFPYARFDIQEAGKCIAFGNETAAVFHLMRAAEWGLRALCVHFGFKKIKNKKKLLKGVVELIPIEYTDWEKMLSQLKSKVDAKLGKLRRGAAKQKLQEFYNPVTRDIEAIRDTFRNHVMHTRAIYNRAQALDALNRVRALMIALAARGVTQL